MNQADMASTLQYSGAEALVADVVKVHGPFSVLGECV